MFGKSDISAEIELSVPSWEELDSIEVGRTSLWLWQGSDLKRFDTSYRLVTGTRR